MHAAPKVEFVNAAEALAAFPRRVWRRVQRASLVRPVVARAADSFKDWSLRLNVTQQRHLKDALLACDTPEAILAFSRHHLVAGQKTREIVEFAGFARTIAPQVFCEIGTLCGGTHLFLARMLPSVTTTIAVDLHVQNKFKLRLLAREGQRPHFVEASSYADATVERVGAILRERAVDLLFIDGDHRYEGVRADFLAYRRFVRPGGLIAFHDICDDYQTRYGRNTGQYAGDVPRFWKTIRPCYEHREFVDSADQDGFGIGVIVYSPGVSLPRDL